MRRSNCRRHAASIWKESRGCTVPATPTPAVCRGAGETAAEHFGGGAVAVEPNMPAPAKDRHGKSEKDQAEAHPGEEREEAEAAAGEQRREGGSKRGAPTEDGGTPKIRNPQKKPRPAVEIEMTPAGREGMEGAGDKASESEGGAEGENAADRQSAGPGGTGRRGTSDRGESPGASTSSASCARKNSKRAKREGRPESRGRSAAAEEATVSKCDDRGREGGGLTIDFAGLAGGTPAAARSRRHRRGCGGRGTRGGSSRSRSLSRGGSRTSSQSSSSAGSDSDASCTSRSGSSEGTALEHTEDSESDSCSADASTRWRTGTRRRRRRTGSTRRRSRGAKAAREQRHRAGDRKPATRVAVSPSEGRSRRGEGVELEASSDSEASRGAGNARGRQLFPPSGGRQRTGRSGRRREPSPEDSLRDDSEDSADARGRERVWRHNGRGGKVSWKESRPRDADRRSAADRGEKRRERAGSRGGKRGSESAIRARESQVHGTKGATPKRGGGAADKALPPRCPTLAEALRKMRRRQRDERELEADLEMQGTKKKRGKDLQNYKFWLATAIEPHPMMIVEEGSPYVRCLHSVLRLESGRKGKLVAAEGDRDASDDPEFVGVKDAHWEWVDVAPPTDCGPGSAIATFFGHRGNRKELFDPRGESMEEKVVVPRMPMAPAAIALKVLEGRVTSWDLTAEVCKLANRSGKRVQELLMPLLVWAVNASCRTNSGGRRMELSFSPLIGRTRDAKKAMARRLDCTLGERHEAAREPNVPRPSHPAWQQNDPYDIARATDEALQRQDERDAKMRRQMVDDMANAYERGAEHVARRVAEAHGDSDYKCFSDTQKATLMGLCGVERWDDIPNFWTEVERTKSEEDLRVLLTRRWNDGKEDIELSIYDVFWADHMLKAIRKVKLAAVPHARHHNYEDAIAPQNFWPRSTDQIRFMEAEARRRREAAGNRTMADLKKEDDSKITRTPPTTLEEVEKGLATYARFLRMIGMENNAHYEGLKDVRKALRELSSRKEHVPKLYVMTVAWKVFDDQCQHFSEGLLMSDFEGSGKIRWPTTGLHRVADQMRGGGRLEDLTFPQKWLSWLERGASPGGRRQPGGRGREGDDSPPQKPRGDDSGRKRGREPGGGRGASPRDPAVQSAKNDKMHADLQKMMQPIKGKGYKPGDVLFAAGTSRAKLRQWSGFADGSKKPCIDFMLGECRFQPCTHPHVKGADVNGGFAKFVVDELSPGVAKLNRDGEAACKRRRDT